MRTLATHRLWRLTLAFGAVILLLSAVIVPFRFAGAQDDEITGDYSVTLARTDIPTDLANGSMAIGHWRISFAADGTFVEERLDLGVLVSGTYELNGDTLTVTDKDGLLSCANPADAPGGRSDVATATYGYELSSRGLTLTPKDEPCPLRRVVFATRAFTFYVACLTVAQGEAATPEARPVQYAEPTDEATPALSESDIFAAIQNAASPVSGPRGEAQAPAGDELTAQIDTLLKQLTACWSTGDPAKFLPLLSNDFQAQFLSGTEQENLDALNALKAAMQVPIVWERAGDVDQTDVDRAEAVVRTTAADQEEFVRYLFVREDDGTWRWDGTAT